MVKSASEKRTFSSYDEYKKAYLPQDYEEESVKKSINDPYKFGKHLVEESYSKVHLLFNSEQIPA